VPPNGGDVFHTVLAGVHVLVVDDVADNREIERLVLEWHGARVTEAGSVAEAVAALDRVVPDIVLTDIHMPGEDGYALLRTIRDRSAGGPAVPVVALTADVSPESRRSASAAGFNNVLFKPVDPHTLVAVLAALLGRY